MQSLEYGNNLVVLKNSQLRINNHLYNNQNSHYIPKASSWLLINPKRLLLQGMMLTSSFNLQNTHQHLSIKFVIKSYLNQSQNQCLQIFPQKGTIMRGQVKKVRVKFIRNNQIKKGDQITVKVYINLNTQYNRQYMRANHLKGWEQIKNFQIQSFQLPVGISHNVHDIKQNIRQEVMFQSEFGKISQDISAFYGQEKFQIPQIGINSRHNIFQSRNRLDDKAPTSRSSLGYSQKKQLQPRTSSNSKPAVFFGNEPAYTQVSPLSIETNKKSILRSRSNSHQSPRASEVPKTTLFKTFQNVPKKQFPEFNPQKPVIQAPYNYHQDSSVSILKELTNTYSREIRKSVKSKANRTQIDGFLTVENLSYANKPEHATQRSIQIIVLAIIAAFFVSLGANLAKIFN